MSARRPRLGDLLVDGGAAKRRDVERAAADAQAHKRALGEILIERRWATEGEVYRALATQHGLQFAEADGLLRVLDPTAQHLIHAVHRDRLRVFPVRVGDEGLELATPNPDLRTSELARLVNGPVQVLLVTPTDFGRLKTDYGLGLYGDGPAPRTSGPEVGEGSQLGPILDAMLNDAVAARASDLHLELYRERVRVRMRIDGDLLDRTHYHLSLGQLRGLLSLIKIHSNLDIAEHRLPQGGRFMFKVGDDNFDVRAQTQPTLFGEHAVLRILPQESVLPEIEDLGFPKVLSRAYRRLLETPTGLVLVVGPTGSGKSTTLYAALKVLSRDQTRKVITIEDPIEYAIEGVQQSQVNRVIGFDFADAMRVFVRQDPDAILVGEIRDTETAREAIRASQTGHLVFSTLHCNDTVDAVQRLYDLGMHPNSIASELTAVFSQRLAKRICRACRRSVSPAPELLAEIFPLGSPPGFLSYAGAGCPRCSERGTVGRIAVIEHLPVDHELRRAIAKTLPLDDLRAVARRNGLFPLVHHALALVMQGTIRLEELPIMLSPEALQVLDPVERWLPAYLGPGPSSEIPTTARGSTTTR